MTGPWSRPQLDEIFGAGRWRCLIRFAIQQGSKWRVIDNGRSAGLNWTLEADERIHTSSCEMSALMGRAIRRHYGKPLAGDYSLVASTHDMKRAFRQLSETLIT